MNVEAGAGAGSQFSDALYVAAGAKIVDKATAFKADIVTKVNEYIMKNGGQCLALAAELMSPMVAGEDSNQRGSGRCRKPHASFVHSTSPCAPRPWLL